MESYFAVVLTKNEISALSNAAWIGVLTALFVGLAFALIHNHPKDRLENETRRAIKWMMLSLACGALHRLYWQSVILFQPNGILSTSGWAEVRAWMPLLAVGFVIGTIGAAREITPTRCRNRVILLLAGWIGLFGGVSVWLA